MELKGTRLLKQVSTVYTPAFMVNGKNWRPGFFSRDLKQENVNAGNLEVNINGNSVIASFKPLNTVASPLTLNVALLAMNLSTLECTAPTFPVV